tara:strand:+ start:5913 stop:6458 length:546 start_codon:yes stop_codon:yes gene_type:complete
MQTINLNTASDLLRAGKVIIHATEGVYGFCASANFPAASEKICEMKGRNLSKGFIVITADIEWVSDWIMPLNPSEITKIESRGSRPCTYLLPRSSNCPLYLCGDHDTLAVRVPHHKQMLSLLNKVGTPLVSTSANKQGQAACNNEESALSTFPTIPVMEFDGKLSGDSSDIVDIKSLRKIR